MRASLSLIVAAAFFAGSSSLFLGPLFAQTLHTETTKGQSATLGAFVESGTTGGTAETFSLEQAISIISDHRDDPPTLLALFQKHEELLTAFDTPLFGDHHVLRSVMDDEELQVVADYIRQSPKIPALLAVYTQNRASSDAILARASESRYLHMKLFYQSCAIALGAEIKDIKLVRLDRPRHACPIEVAGLLEQEIARNRTSRHSDGIYRMVITGDVISDAGLPATLKVQTRQIVSADSEIEAKWRRVESHYDPQTGRFHFTATVPAAFNVGAPGLHGAAPLNFKLSFGAGEEIEFLTGPQPPHLLIDCDSKLPAVHTTHGQASKRPASNSVSPSKEHERWIADTVSDMRQIGGVKGTKYNPRVMIRVINTMQSRGKSDSLAAIQEYVKLEPDQAIAPARETALLVLRVLFEIPEEHGHAPRLSIGKLFPDAPTTRDEELALPLYPVVLINDVPLVVTTDLASVGDAATKWHLKYYEDHGILRKRPLRPCDDFSATIEEFLTVSKTLDYAEYGDAEAMLCRQLLLLVDDEVNLGQARASIREFSQLQEAVRGRRLVWKPEGQAYVGAVRTKLHTDNKGRMTSIDLSEQDAVNDEFLEQLGNCLHVVHFHALYTNIKGPGLRVLRESHDLETLDLYGSPVGDEGLAHLKDLRNLRNVNLIGSKITDISIPVLLEWKKLEYLGIADTGITREGADRLKGALPDCEVDY